MATTSATDQSQYSKLLLIPLVAVGVAGNLFDTPLLIDAEFQQGSVLALLAVYCYGTCWGTVAAALIASCTCLLWNQPYVLIVMTCEAAVVGLLLGRRKLGMIQADTVFWVVAGMPLYFTFCHLAMHLPTDTSYFLTTKLAVNAIANAMVARLILTWRVFKSPRSLTPLREAIFNLLAFFVFCPIFALFILSSRRDFDAADSAIRQEVVQQSRNMNNLVMDWLQGRKSILTALAGVYESEPRDRFQIFMDRAVSLDHNYRRIEFLDYRRGKASTAPGGIGPQQGFQASLPGRASLEWIRQERQPVVWEVAGEGLHPSHTLAVLVLPEPDVGAIRGCIVGILNLKQLQDTLNNNLDQRSTLYSVIDAQGRVILTNRSDQKVLTSYFQAKGTLKGAGNGVSRWFPVRDGKAVGEELWKQSSYLCETSLGEAGWKLVVEQPLASFQFALFGDNRDKFAILFLVLLGALAMAEILSRRTVSLLDQFNELTDGLPDRLMANRSPIGWPRTSVAEVDHLINNFRFVAESLTPLYFQVNELNGTLESRVAERSRNLAESQALTIGVMDSLLSSISVLDERGDIILVNEPWLRFARENAGADSGYLGTNLLEVCRTSMERDGCVAAASALIGISAVLQGERDYFTLEYACELPQETRWFQMTASKLTSDLSGAVVFHSDITDRKQAEEALQASEEKHRLLFESAGDGIFILDRQLKILTANPLACFRLGYRDAELTSLSFGQLELPRQNPQLPSFTDSLFKRGFLLYETVLVHSDGSLLATEVNARMTIWNKEVAIMAICRDLTERKRAQEELGEAKQFIEQVISCAQEGIVAYDMDLRYRCWNPFMEELTGLSAQEVIGRHPAELFPVEAQSGLLEHLQAARCGTAKHDFDLASVSAMGDEQWTSSLSSQLLNTRGEVAGVITTVREITWRKQMESELRQALTRAEAANTGMRRLLRTVSHEFRTPLGLLTGCADILDRHWNKLRPEQRDLQTGHIRNAAAQLTVLVDSVTSYSLAQVEHAGQTRLQELGPLCASIAADVSSVWKAGHTFDAAVDPGCGTGHINEILLRRILENLLSNAFRYTPPEGTVALKVRRAEDRLLLEVTDTGIGISEDDQKLIFDPFYRGQNIENRRGLGLGLAIVQETLSKLEGSITVTSGLGAGSVMRVYIPVDK